MPYRQQCPTDHSFDSSQSETGLANSYRITMSAERKGAFTLHTIHGFLLNFFYVVSTKRKETSTFVKLVDKRSQQRCYVILKCLCDFLRDFLSIQVTRHQLCTQARIGIGLPERSKLLLLCAFLSLCSTSIFFYGFFSFLLRFFHIHHSSFLCMTYSRMVNYLVKTVIHQQESQPEWPVNTAASASLPAAEAVVFAGYSQ